MEIKTIVFDWGDTVMRDFPFPGAMKDWPFVSLIPNIKEVLAELKRDYLLVMASNAVDSTADDILEALKRVDVHMYFDHVFSSKDIGCEKPELGFFRFIEHDLKLNPDQLIMVGNNCFKDIEGAKKANWNTIWFNENQEQKKECSSADATIYHMSILNVIIEKMKNNE